MKTVSENLVNKITGNAPPVYAQQLTARSGNFSQHSCIYTQGKTPSSRNILDQLPAAVISINSHGTITYLNSSASDMLPGCMPGCKWSEIISGHFTLSDSNGQTLQLTDGAIVDICTAPMEDGEGQIIMLSDVTEINRIQSDINKNQRLSELGKMASFLAHQIRTPVATALLILSRLRQTSGEIEKRSVENVISRLRHLDSVVTDILIYAKGDRSQFENVLLQDIFDEFLFIVQKKCEAHDVELYPEIDVSELCARMNQHLYLSALMNVVDNAIESMQEQKKLFLAVNSAHGNLVVQIADTGSGMDLKTKQQMFSPFYTSKGNGTGLGLAVLDMVVTQHGGSVEVDSEAGRGSRFIISIPLEVQS